MNVKWVKKKNVHSPQLVTFLCFICNINQIVFFMQKIHQYYNSELGRVKMHAVH
jgi:hypothetical protein